eukprot:6309951-Amphidinium_carterae.1
MPKACIYSYLDRIDVEDFVGRTAHGEEHHPGITAERDTEFTLVPKYTFRNHVPATIFSAEAFICRSSGS